jgi:hypothetical protein
MRSDLKPLGPIPPDQGGIALVGLEGNSRQATLAGLSESIRDEETAQTLAAGLRAHGH